MGRYLRARVGESPELARYSTSDVNARSRGTLFLAELEGLPVAAEPGDSRLWALLPVRDDPELRRRGASGTARGSLRYARERVATSR